MKVTWTLSLLASILASGFVLCLSDQDYVASEILSTSRTINRNRQDVFLQDFPGTTTAHLIGPSVSSRENSEKVRYYGNDDESHNRAYSRPRSLLLFMNDDAYVHVDVSDQFSYHGKLYVSLLFLAFWVLSIIPRFKKRAAIIRLVGAVLMVGLRHLLLQSGHGPRFEIESLLFWKPLVVQFGLMLVTIGLEKTEHGGLVQKMGEVLDAPVPWKRCRNIVLLSTVGSAVLSRDLAVFLFSGVVVDLCIRHNVGDPMPYLLSLSTAANIGSAMTLSGTFSNLLVAILPYDIISWPDFAKNLLLPTASASTINILLIMLFYRSELFHGPRGDFSNSEQVYEMVGSGEDEECKSSPCEYMAIGEVPQQRNWSLWSILQLVCVGVYMICFAAGLSIPKVSMGAGVCMMILHLCNRMYYQGSASMCQGGGSAALANNDDGEDQVATTARRIPFDYGILVTHLAHFILVGSLSDTGVPQTGFYLSLGRGAGCADQITGGLCVYRFVAIIAVLSAIFSSASVVQMFAATFPYATPYDWMQVSFAANMAGNLGLYGSSAHYTTVGDQFARTTGKSSPVSIRSYVLFGVVSASLSLLVGTSLLANFHFAFECSYRLGECDEIWHG